jgi:hypothetical protein
MTSEKIVVARQMYNARAFTRRTDRPYLGGHPRHRLRPPRLHCCLIAWPVTSWRWGFSPRRAIGRPLVADGWEVLQSVRLQAATRVGSMDSVANPA